MSKIVRVITSSVSLNLLRGQMPYMSRNGHTFFVAFGGPFEDSASNRMKAGVPVYEIKHLVRPVKPFSDLLSLYELIKVIKRLHPDIVHTQTPKAGLLGMIAAWFCGVPYRIHSVGGMPLMTRRGVMRFILNLTETVTYKAATLVVPNSKTMASFIVDHHYAPRSKIIVLNNGSTNGIDLEYFDRTPDVLKQAMRIREEVGGSFAYLFVGRIVRDKGITELVDAFERVHVEHPETRLLLVGTQEPELDPLPDRTQRLIADNDAIIESGWQDDVRPWFVASDLFTFPSYREGFPNVVMQAGALGIPSIVTDINGSNEIIIEGKNGTIIPTRDTDALYRKMSEALEQRDRLTEMSAQCRPLIASRYRQEDVWQATLEVYRSLTDDAK